MKRLSGTGKWYLGAVLAAFAVLGAGWFLLVSPQLTSASELQAVAEGKLVANSTLQKQIDQLKVDSKNLPTIKKQADQILSHLPPTPLMSDLIRDISNQAKAAAVTLTAVTPQQPAPLTADPQQATSSGSNNLTVAGQVNQIPVTIQVSGSFAHMRTFITNIENMNRSFLIVGVDITRADSGDGTTTSSALKATLDGRVFMANVGAPSSTSVQTAAGSVAGTTAN